MAVGIEDVAERWARRVGVEDLTRSRSQRRNLDRRSDALCLPHPFVISKDKGLILYDRPTRRAAKLIAPELRHWGVGTSGKIISRVQCTVSNELIQIAVEGVRARLRDRVYDSARGLAVFGREASGEDREFLNGVHAQRG